MMTTLTSVAVLTIQLTVGGLGLFDCLKKDRHAFGGADCCLRCESEVIKVHNLLEVLQYHVSASQRVDAARSLRSYDWQCHPEMVPVLADVLINDCEKKVRKAVAETLAKLHPCDPTAQVALEQAAISDSDFWTRRRARKALDRIDRGCGSGCSVCAPIAVVGEVVGTPLPVEYEVEIETLPPLRAPRVYGEVPYDRVAPLYERRVPTLPPADVTEPSRSDIPVLPDPNARPELLPRSIEPFELEAPVEVAPPDVLPLPTPPSVSPFGASRGVEEPPRPPARAARPIRIFTIGRPR
ncbi:HEAT repeat domain-containing protein [Tautonia rosea]|uniref:HEAT repeat domain-containing protein n=1 Tax=Tautonia rosea TaxID=2728037 RepID=UPI001472D900|nr:HEAT repeat domain-containing protein [Tautonia rosea]